MRRNRGVYGEGIQLSGGSVGWMHVYQPGHE